MYYRDRVDETCTGLFHKDLNKGHFLMGEWIIRLQGGRVLLGGILFVYTNGYFYQ